MIVRPFHVVSRFLFSPQLAPSIQCVRRCSPAPIAVTFTCYITFSFFPSTGSFGSVRCSLAPILVTFTWYHVLSFPFVWLLQFSALFLCPYNMAWTCLYVSTTMFFNFHHSFLSSLPFTYFWIFCFFVPLCPELAVFSWCRVLFSPLLCLLRLVRCFLLLIPTQYHVLSVPLFWLDRVNACFPAPITVTFTCYHVLFFRFFCLLRYSALLSCSYFRYVHLLSRFLFSFSLAFGSVSCFRALIAWHVRVYTPL